jgi:hypothetical protein
VNPVLSASAAARAAAAAAARKSPPARKCRARRETSARALRVIVQGLGEPFQLRELALFLAPAAHQVQ